jgi:diaminopimelate decarboxylase
MFLYSKAKLTANFKAYEQAMGDLPHIIGYAVKANNNLELLRHLSSLSSGAVLVSGNELQVAKAAGFDTTKCEFLFQRDLKSHDECRTLLVHTPRV